MSRRSGAQDSPQILEFRAGSPGVPHQGREPSIDEGMIHLWAAPYTTLARINASLSALVSPEEWERAAGFKKPEDARQYILRHAMVRAVLGPYLHRDPGKIPFIQGTNGKPGLDQKDAAPQLRFSLSRTDEMVCLGITSRSAIGLDLVKIHSGYSFSAIAGYLFTPGERRWIAQAVPPLRPFRFFRIWALKEALLKAAGGSARMMQEADVAGIMTEFSLNGWYPVHIRKEELLFFIQESGCGSGHHRVMVTQ